MTYTYDADGQRVKKVEDGQTTVYIGNLYEKNLTTGVVTTYYYAGSQRIAQRQGGSGFVVSYFVGDNLGSTSVTMNDAGGEVGRQKYYPFGAPRTQSGTLKTDYRFTGQRSEEANFGSLYDYGARFYSPVLGRFISPDTMIPEPGNPQSLNRYAYTANNPLRYTDPTGHWLESALDIAFIIYDIHDIATNGLNLTSGLSLAADVVGLALPAVTGGGLLVRSAAHADDVAKVLSHGDEVAKAATHLDEAAKAASHVDNMTDVGRRGLTDIPCSFDAGTPVLTPDGLITIESLRAGDLVWAYDELSGATGVFTVTARAVHLDPAVIVLTVAGETIDTTPEHPFYTLDGEWTPAGELMNGDLVRRADGGFGAVESVQLVARPALMYNLTVDQAHTFFVGEEGWLVHNTCPIELYQVGEYNDLKNMPRRDNIQIHHAPQAHAAQQVIPGYDRGTAPSIALPISEHTSIPNLRGSVDLTPRQLLAKSISDLRKHTKAPNSSLQKLIKLNKQKYPGAMKK